jgi:hypothetical protein
MESNVIVQVVIDENHQIAVQMGEACDDISPATLVGILEQVKMTIFENVKVEKVVRSNKPYDA